MLTTLELEEARKMMPMMPAEMMMTANRRCMMSVCCCCIVVVVVVVAVLLLLLLLLLLLSIVLSYFIHVHGMIVVYYALSSVDVATAVAFFGKCYIWVIFFLSARRQRLHSNLFHSRGVCFTNNNTKVRQTSI